MQHNVLFLFDFLNIKGLRMHELLVKNAVMRLKGDFLPKCLYLGMSIGNELEPSPLYRK